MLHIYKWEKAAYFYNSDVFNILCICICVLYKHSDCTTCSTCTLSYKFVWDFTEWNKIEGL